MSGQAKRTCRIHLRWNIPSRIMETEQDIVMKLHFPSFFPAGRWSLAVVMAAMYFAQGTAGGVDSNLQPADFNRDIRPDPFRSLLCLPRAR